MGSPIEDYLHQLRRRLPTDRATTASILDEVRGHLEERAAHLREAGVDATEAEREAVAFFGDSRVVGRQFALVHSHRWGIQQYLRVVAAGALSTWLIWTLGSFPVLANHEYAHAATYPAEVSPSAFTLLSSASPLSSGGWYAFYLTGWYWLAPLLLLWCVMPFLWGRRADRWWMAGALYGLGAWLAVPWFVLVAVRPNLDFTFADESYLVLSAVPLALLASLLGHIWSARGLRGAGPVSMSKHRKTVWMAAIALVLVLAGAVDTVSFVRYHAVSAHPPLTVQQQLALARHAVRFQIAQPAYVPPGMQLAQVIYDTSCGDCSGSGNVTLIYGGGEYPDGIQLLETDQNFTFEVSSQQVECQQGKACPMQIIQQRTLSIGAATTTETVQSGTMVDGSTITVADVWWRTGGMSYEVSANDVSDVAATLSDLEAIARSL